MKRCTKCKKNFKISNFNWKIKNVKLQPHCIDCSRKYVREHYRKNLNYYLVKARKRNKMVRERSYAFLGPYLLEHPCVDCGESDILVLEFDHRDRKMKNGEVSRIIHKGVSLDTLYKEVVKCDVRCANCHRKKTHIENNCWRLKYINAHSSTG